MRRPAVLAVCGYVTLALSVVLSDGRVAGQATFRAGVDLVDVEVSVLDRNRLPVRGLTLEDFTVLEDGQPRPIVVFTPIELPPKEMPSAPWMAEIAPDTQSNEFAREGRLVVILLDRSVTFEQSAMARRIAEAAVRELRPGDLAAVTYSLYGVPQNFTADRRLLLHAINQPSMNLPEGRSLNPAECRCGVCSLEAIIRIAEAIQDVRQRRKILLFIGSSIPIQSLGDCSALQTPVRVRATRAAEASNLTIHTFDPMGLELPPFGAADRDRPQSSAASMRRLGNLRFFPDLTGGRAVLASNAPAESLPSIFRESSAYYSLGFQPAHTDGKFHEIKVRAGRRDVTLQARRGYYAAGGKPKPASRAPVGVPPTLYAALSGLWPKTEIPLRLAAVPVAMPGLRKAALALTLGVRQERPANRDGTVGELARPDAITTVNILVGAFDPNGLAASNLVSQTVTVSPRRLNGQVFEYEVLTRLELGPGRYEIRAALEDRTMGAVGSVYTYVEVPDFFKDFVSMSGVFLEESPAGVSVPADAFGDLVPVVPTSRREFARSDRVTAAALVYQGVTHAAMPGYLTAEILDDQGRLVFRQESRIVPGDFGANRAMAFSLDIPVARLEPGPYLLTIEVRHGNATARRDARFSVK